MRDIVSLACEACKRKNYTTTRNKKLAKEKLEVKKFCPFCRGHKNHKEGKV
jgi:large subunit ribosomal protein L33